MYTIPKKAGGYRRIEHPSRRLKALQRWLLFEVIAHLPIHPSATAYLTGKSILDNAKPHVDSKYLLRMDLQNFFGSITENDLRSYFASNPTKFAKWNPSDIEIFCGLVCRNRVLTIGAPTSPALSNVICHDLDVELHAVSEVNDVVYTRYADDLFFSTITPDVLGAIEKEVIKIVGEIKRPAGLKVNASKTRHSSKKGARHVTGIVLGSDDAVHIGRKLKRKIRHLIHEYATLGGAERASLAGLIAYASALDPEFHNSLIAKYGLPAIRAAMTQPPRP